MLAGLIVVEHVHLNMFGGKVPPEVCLQCAHHIEGVGQTSHCLIHRSNILWHYPIFYINKFFRLVIEGVRHFFHSKE